jgi:hypothetical protein
VLQFSPPIKPLPAIFEKRSATIPKVFSLNPVDVLARLPFETDALAAEAAQDIGNLIACLGASACSCV